VIPCAVDFPFKFAKSNSIERGMPPPFKTTWRVYAPAIFVSTVYAAVVYFNRVKQPNLKKDHDFVPIYGENGKLEGFTHPTIVDAANKWRESNASRN
jgi:hypothetical protein